MTHIFVEVLAKAEAGSELNFAFWAVEISDLHQWFRLKIFGLD